MIWSSWHAVSGRRSPKSCGGRYRYWRGRRPHRKRKACKRWNNCRKVSLSARKEPRTGPRKSVANVPRWFATGRLAETAIHLDTCFLIRALVPGTEPDLRLRRWLRQGQRLCMDSIAWTEFLCGPLLIQSEVLPHSGLRTDSPARQGGEGIAVLRRVTLTPQADSSGAPAGLASRRVWTALSSLDVGSATDFAPTPCHTRRVTS